MSSVRIDASGNELRQMSIWLPVDVIRLIKADGLNMTRLNLEILEIIYGGEPGEKVDRNRLVEAAHAAFGRQSQVDAEREADRERARDAVRAMRADREAAQVRQAGIADALQTIVGKKAGQYRRVLPENDPYGDHINEWDALVAGVSRRCGAAVDSAEVAGALRALVAASA